jgi:hypothetical protein
MTTYVVHFTDVNATPISVYEQSVDDTSTDISIFGYIRLSYGEALQENLLHVLENFACPEDPLVPGIPDLATTYGNLLQNPTRGQFWYNSTARSINYWTGTNWVPMRGGEDVAANWGTIGHGEQLPRPISPTTGYEFDYDECIWSVAPANYEASFSGMNCSTDNQARVTMEYSFTNTGELFYGSVVNYLIIGIKGNKNLGYNGIDPPQISGVTPTPTPTPGGLTPTPSFTPTINVTRSVTPTATSTPAITPTFTPTPSPFILGLNTRLYTSPSPGDPGGVGPGGIDTQLYGTCGPTITYNQVEQSYFISLQNIEGGTGPYMVSFRWITVTPDLSWYEGDTVAQRTNLWPDMTLTAKYYGGTGTVDNYQRTGVDGTMYPRMEIKPVFKNSVTFNPALSYFINYHIQGYVLLTDAYGQSKQWWIPRYPTEVGGSDINDPVTWVHSVSYSHHANCYDCATCR